MLIIYFVLGLQLILFFCLFVFCIVGWSRRWLILTGSSQARNARTFLTSALPGRYWGAPRLPQSLQRILGCYPGGTCLGHFLREASVKEARASMWSSATSFWPLESGILSFWSLSKIQDQRWEWECWLAGNSSLSFFTTTVQYTASHDLKILKLLHLSQAFSTNPKRASHPFFWKLGGANSHCSCFTFGCKPPQCMPKVLAWCQQNQNRTWNPVIPKVDSLQFPGHTQKFCPQKLITEPVRKGSPAGDEPLTSDPILMEHSYGGCCETFPGRLRGAIQNLQR